MHKGCIRFPVCFQDIFVLREYCFAILLHTPVDKLIGRICILYFRGKDFVRCQQRKLFKYRRIRIWYYQQKAFCLIEYKP